MEKKIVFCGGGNMAEGIIRSLLDRGTAKSEDIAVSEPNPQRCEYLRETYGVNALTDATEEMKKADLFVIAVLPKIVPVVARSIKAAAKEDSIVVSIAAGVRISAMEEILGADRKIVRVMPNTLGQSGNGHSAVCLNENVNEEEKAFVSAIIGALGQIMYLPESRFNEFTAYSCSGPMWLYQMADVLIDAGVYAGFSREDARRIVIKNMLGVAMTLNASGEEPKSRVSEMCSPGGVTIEGYRSLVDEGFASAVMTSVDKAVKKANAI